jgi:hypothetical protein
VVPSKSKINFSIDYKSRRIKKAVRKSFGDIKVITISNKIKKPDIKAISLRCKNSVSKTSRIKNPIKKSKIDKKPPS